MKKIMSLILAVMLVVSAAGLLSADVVYNREPGARISIYNLSKTGTTTLVTSITSSNRIIGYKFSDTAAGTVAFYDLAAVASVTSTNQIDEAMVIAGGSLTEIFPTPRAITNGLVIQMLNSTGTITIYYE